MRLRLKEYLANDCNASRDNQSLNALTISKSFDTNDLHRGRYIHALTEAVACNQVISPDNTGTG